jgi:oligopeptide/dipeptide ABC transporter ATP-binding protein
MRRRVMIAMALACRPALLIADEPTTGLDAPIQAQILDLLARLARSEDRSVLFITHDLCVAAEVASEIVVLYGGQVVEAGPVRSVLGSPQHPYTIGLLENIPDSGYAGASPVTETHSAVSPCAAGPSAESTASEQGCRYAPHCPQWRRDPQRFVRCAVERPLLEPAEARHRSRCFYPRLAGH